MELPTPTVPSTLPANVLVSSFVGGKPRYGVKVKMPWMRNQVRCGSSFTNTQQAATIAKLFIDAARQSCRDCRIPPLAHADDVIVLDEFEMQAAEKLGTTIEMYRRRSTVRRFALDIGLRLTTPSFSRCSRCTPPPAPFPSPHTHTSRRKHGAASSTSCGPASRTSTSSSGAKISKAAPTCASSLMPFVRDLRLG